MIYCNGHDRQKTPILSIFMLNHVEGSLVMLLYFYYRCSVHVKENIVSSFRIKSNINCNTS